MDLTALLLPSGPPRVVTAEAVILPGFTTPVVIPLQALPNSLRGTWLATNPQATMRQRIAAALVSDQWELAWSQLRGSPDPLLIDISLEGPVTAWLNRECRRLGIISRNGLVIKTPGGFIPDTSDARLGLRDTTELLASLSWPRWLGPVIAIPRTDALAASQGDALIRPAMPVVLIANDRPTRVDIAAATAQLALNLSAPPHGGWPSWIVVGAAEVCAGIARGEGPSPRAMHAIRQNAGEPAIRALFTAPQADPVLAKAVCAWFLHTNRRHRFAALLDPMRHGSDAETAIQIAYGIAIPDLLTQR